GTHRREPVRPRDGERRRASHRGRSKAPWGEHRRRHQRAPGLATPRARNRAGLGPRSEEHTSELQSRFDLVCRLLLEKKNRSNHQGCKCTEASALTFHRCSNRAPPLDHTPADDITDSLSSKQQKRTEE